MNRASFFRIIWRTLVVAALATGGAAIADEGADAGTSAGGKVHKVKMKGMVFVPAVLEVSVGDTVVWENEDVVPHTATAMKAGVPIFNSGNLQSKQTWSYVAEKRGTLPYVCLLHPMMKGTLKVR